MPPTASGAYRRPAQALARYLSGRPHSAAPWPARSARQVARVQQPTVSENAACWTQADLPRTKDTGRAPDSARLADAKGRLRPGRPPGCVSVSWRIAVPADQRLQLVRDGGGIDQGTRQAVQLGPGVSRCAPAKTKVSWPAWRRTAPAPRSAGRSPGPSTAAPGPGMLNMLALATPPAVLERGSPLGRSVLRLHAVPDQTVGRGPDPHGQAQLGARRPQQAHEPLLVLLVGEHGAGTVTPGALRGRRRCPRRAGSTTRTLTGPTAGGGSDVDREDLGGESWAG